MGRPPKNAPSAAEIANEALDDALLTNEEKAAIEAEVETKVAGEHRKKTTDAYRSKVLKEKRKEKGLAAGPIEPEMRVILLELAEHSDRITLDGKVYFH